MSRLAPYAIALAAAVGLRVMALGGLHGARTEAFLDNPAAALGPGVRIATALWVHVRYAWLMLWPVRLSSDYSYDAIPPVETVADPRWLAGFVFLAALTGWAVRARTRQPPLFLGVAIWLLFLLASSNVLLPAGTIMAERLVYLPSLGACLLAGHLGAWAMMRAGRRRRRLVERVTLVAVVGVPALLCARTIDRNLDWKDNLTLALTDVRTVPRSAKLHAGAAIALHESGELDRAGKHYRQALRIYPEYAQMHYNHGVLLESLARYEEAIRHYRRAAEISPENPRPPKALARLLARTGRPERSLAYFADGARLDPSDHAFRLGRARALLRAGRHDEALEVCERLARDDPDGGAGRCALALVLRAAGRTDAARKLCREILEDPDVPADARALCGIVLSAAL